MNKLISYSFILICLSWVSCRNSSYKSHSRSPEPVEFKISDHSSLFNEELLKIEIDTLDNILHVCLMFEDKALKKFPFPKYKNTQTLTGTNFTFGIYHNGKLLEGAGLTGKDSPHRYFGYNKWLSKDLTWHSDSLDMKNIFTVPFFIPLYAFQKLKAGPNDLELKISQTHFFSATKFLRLHVDSLGDSTFHDARNIMSAPLLSATIKFRINMPKIFRTTVYGQSIELRNDSVYSPAGMDNTIWNSSYPDIYWTIDFPDNDLYCSSDYQKSTSLYDIKDTFELFHYTPYDTIKIGVWDHDNLSRDDYISYEKFSLGKFKQNAVTSFAFENIKEFKIKVDRKGYINK